MNNKKLNDGCLKIFQLLELLYQDNADYENVIEIFKDKNENNVGNNAQVNLNKFINTLKIFGLKIKKENNKFKLQNSLYNIQLSEEDLKSISILSSSLDDFPEGEISNDLNYLLNAIELRMSAQDKITLSKLKQSNKDLSFFYAGIREQIQQCEQICKEKYIINITYQKKSKEITRKCTPKEVIYDSKTAYLKIYDQKTRENEEIPIQNILSIIKLPQIASNIEMSTTVVYKLKNRLAKTYKVKENEYIDSYLEDGSIIIINKDEPFDNLIKRLLRYSYSCEILSPKTLREEFKQVINDTLSQYEE